MSEQKTAVAVLPTEIVTIDPDTYVAQLYQPFETRLASAREAAKGVTYEISTKEGMEVAKAHRRVFKDIRIELEKKREESKGPIIKIGKLIDSRAKEITAKVTPEEDRFDKDIKAEEQRIEDEKAAKIKAEAERNAQIQRDIDNIKSMPLAAMNMDSSGIQMSICAMREFVATTAMFGERFVEAEMAVNAVVGQLTTMLEGKKAQEQLAAMQEAQRVEAERLTKIAAEEKAADDARAREEQAAQSAALKAQQVEIERRRAEMAAQMKAIEDQRAALLAEVAAKDLAESDARAKIEAEAQEKASREAAAKVAEEVARILKEQANEIAGQQRALDAKEDKELTASVVELPSKYVRPSDDEIIAALAINFRVHESKVIEWLLDMDLNEACERMAKEFA